MKYNNDFEYEYFDFLSQGVEMVELMVDRFEEEPSTFNYETAVEAVEEERELLENEKKRISEDLLWVFNKANDRFTKAVTRLEEASFSKKISI